MKRIYILLLTLFFAIGCVEYHPEEFLLELDEISLTIRGQEKMRFDDYSYQIGYNNRKNEFRVLDDRLTRWFTLTCDSAPASIGQEVTGNLEYTTQDDIKKLSGLRFTVEKTDSNGLVWLWESSKSIGVVIKLL